MSSRTRRRAGGRKPTRRRSKRPENPLARLRALDTLSRMRAGGLSLAHAARIAGTTPRTVRKYVGRALTQEAHGRYQAKPHDRLARRLRFPTVRGVVELVVRDSRTASRIARYWAAVDHYLKTGETGRLRQFRGKSVRAGKLGHPFLTNPKTLDRLANAGEVSFEDLYAHTT